MEFNSTLTVDDFASICRLCLKRKSRLKPVFKSKVEIDLTNTAATSFDQMITICFGIEVNTIFVFNFNFYYFGNFYCLQVSPDDGLPLFICSLCCNKLIDGYSFRLQCLAAFDFLKNIQAKQECTNRVDKDNDIDQEDFVDFKQDIGTISSEAVCSPEKSSKSTNKQNFTDENIFPAQPLQSNVPKKYKAVRIVKLKSYKSLTPRKAKPDRSKLAKKSDTSAKKTGRSRLLLSLEEKKQRKRIGLEAICSICGKFTKNIYTHTRTHHEERETFECEYCQRIYAAKTSLLGHFKIHFAERFVLRTS